MLKSLLPGGSVALTLDPSAPRPARVTESGAHESAIQMPISRESIFDTQSSAKETTRAKPTLGIGVKCPVAWVIWKSAVSCLSG